jgi:hypothetical protein
VSRVWEAILACWSLPELVTAKAPIAILDRNSHLALSGRFESMDAQAVNPLDPEAIGSLSGENGAFCERWNADVFLSSWISTAEGGASGTRALALVHDCMPERSQPDAPLLAQRKRWLQNAESHLAVSAATAEDVEGLLKLPTGHVAWCHPGSESRFSLNTKEPQAQRLWQQLQAKQNLHSRYILLPATSCIGSYKNPELVARALSDPRLKDIKLVICGIAAAKRCKELVALEPNLQGRCESANFTELELALAYRHALAVVIPSRIEGFGLPAVEAMASGGRVIVADSRGLREAGAEAALRCQPDDPGSLTSLLLLLGDDRSGHWIEPLLEERRQKRLQRLCPDLIGLALLTQARQLKKARNSLYSQKKPALSNTEGSSASGSAI